MSTLGPSVTLREVNSNGIRVHVAEAGSGPEVLLLHGFPHTWQVWTPVLAALSADHRVLAPDLRGLGASARASDGYDAAGLARDLEGVLDALDAPDAAVVAIDASVPAAFLFALDRPERVRRLALMESLLGPLPGAEDFLAAGPPWWFGFHAVPGLAETVLLGHEAEYLDWFLDAGTRGRGLPREIRDAFVTAYTGADALRCAFSYYRAMPVSGAQIIEAVSRARLGVPTLAVGAHPVGDALERQLRPLTDDLTAHSLPDCGHIIPLDRPDELLAILTPFLAEDLHI